MKEPDYYISNGLSPIGAFKQGLISEDEYRGFLIGNIIKYTIRAGKKDNAIQDLKKARNYIDFYLELVDENLSINETVDPGDLNVETLKLPPEVYDETGTLKPEASDAIQKFLLDRRESEDD